MNTGLHYKFGIGDEKFINDYVDVVFKNIDSGILFSHQPVKLKT